LCQRIAEATSQSIMFFHQPTHTGGRPGAPKPRIPRRTCKIINMVHNITCRTWVRQPGRQTGNGRVVCNISKIVGRACVSHPFRRTKDCGRDCGRSPIWPPIARTSISCFYPANRDVVHAFKGVGGGSGYQPGEVLPKGVVSSVGSAGFFPDRPPSRRRLGGFKGLPRPENCKQHSKLLQGGGTARLDRTAQPNAVCGATEPIEVT
jgi:hypothetical protein